MSTLPSLFTLLRGFFVVWPALECGQCTRSHTVEEDRFFLSSVAIRWQWLLSRWWHFIPISPPGSDFIQFELVPIISMQSCSLWVHMQLRCCVLKTLCPWTYPNTSGARHFSFPLSLWGEVWYEHPAYSWALYSLFFSAHSLTEGCTKFHLLQGGASLMRAEWFSDPWI